MTKGSDNGDLDNRGSTVLETYFKMSKIKAVVLLPKLSHNFTGLNLKPTIKYLWFLWLKLWKHFAVDNVSSLFVTGFANRGLKHAIINIYKYNFEIFISIYLKND